MEDKELKKRLKKIPDVDKNGDPIYKIDLGLGGGEKVPNEKPKKRQKLKIAAQDFLKFGGAYL